MSEACIFLQSVNVLRNINYANCLRIGSAKQAKHDLVCSASEVVLCIKTETQRAAAVGSRRLPEMGAVSSLPLCFWLCKAAMGGMGGMQESVVGT